MGSVSDDLSKEGIKLIKKQLEDNKEWVSTYNKIMTYLRDVPRADRELIRPVLRDFRDLIPIFADVFKSEKIKPEKAGTINEWINFAKDDLKLSQVSKKIRANGLALYHLQQGVEKLVKAYAMSLGIIEEKDLREYGHKAGKFYVKVLQDPFFMELVKQFYPKAERIGKRFVSKKEFKRIYAPIGEATRFLEKISFEEELKHPDVQFLVEWLDFEKNKESLKKILNLDKAFPSIIEQIIYPSYYRFSMVINRVMDSLTKTISDKIGAGEVKRLEKKGIKLPTIIEKASLATKWCEGFTFLLFPLSFATLIYESSGRYPDKKREFGIQYEDSGLLKCLDEIKILLDQHIRDFEKFVDC